MSLFGKFFNSACDSSIEQADRIMRIGEEKRRAAEKRGDFTEEKRKMYNERMSKLQKQRDAAAYSKDLYNSLHDDD